MSFRNVRFLLSQVWSVAPARVLLAVGERCLQFSFGAFYTLLFFRYFINSAQEGRSLWEVAWFFALFTIYDGLQTLLCALLRHRYYPRIDPIIRGSIARRLGEHAVKVEYASYEHSGFFDRFSAAGQRAAEDALASVEHLAEIVGGLFALVVNTGFAAWVEPGVLAVALPFLLLMFVLGRRQNAARGAYEADCVRPRREADYARRTVYMREYAQDLRTTAIWRPIIARFERAGGRLIALGREHGLPIALWRFGCEFSTQIGLFVALNGFVAWRCLAGDGFMLGDYASLQGAAVNFMHFVAMIAEEWIAMGKLGATAAFAREFLELPMARDEGVRDKVRPDELVMEQVSFRYPGAAADTLRDISFSIKAGERVALVGENGAGKTTLVKLLLRLYAPTSGRVRMGGVDAREFTLDAWRTQFATTYQDFQIYAATLAENVLMGPCAGEADEARVRRALEGCGLPPDIHIPLTREFEEGGAQLSGGQAQRVALARVLASGAPIALMDEPSAALDPLGEYAFFESLLRGFAGKSVVFVSHRLSAATLADRILFLEAGRIVEEGSHRELMGLNGRYARMFRVQARNYLEEVET